MKYVQNVKQMNAIINRELANTNAPHSIGFPEGILVTTTLRCNYRCIMCYQRDYSGEIDPKVFDEIEPLLPFAKRLSIFGGEPLLYSGIRDIYAMAHRHDSMITMISNGSLLTDSMCEAIVSNRVGHIKFSIDAGTPETYEKIRGGNFHKVLKGIATISLLKVKHRVPSPDMHFNFLAMRSNVAELPKLISIAAEIGVSQINVFYPTLNKKELVDECVWFCQDHSDRWLKKAEILAASLGVGLNLPPLFSECEGLDDVANRPLCTDPWTKLLISPDGSATLCCGGPTKIGNLLEEGFEAVWNGKRANRIRAKVNTPQESAYCKACRVRKPDPSEIGLHISDKAIQEYGLQKYGIPHGCILSETAREPVKATL